MDGLAEDESCRFRPCTSSSVTEASGSGSTASETLKIEHSARGIFNLTTSTTKSLFVPHVNTDTRNQ